MEHTHTHTHTHTQKVSNWILTHQPHRVTSGQSNCCHKWTFQNSPHSHIHICKSFLKSNPQKLIHTQIQNGHTQTSKLSDSFWAPHLEMSPKHFTKTTLALLSVSKQTHSAVVICEWVTVAKQSFQELIPSILPLLKKQCWYNWPSN